MKPYHVAIIMDGNGRWAKQIGLKRVEGHKEGAKRVEEITETARRIGIKYLTLYAFSEDNWKRPKEEVQELMKLLKEYMITKREKLKKNGVKLKIIGNIEKFPEDVLKEIVETINYTKDCNDMVLSLALSYSGRYEIVKSARRLAEKCVKGEIEPKDITVEMFSKEIGNPPVDLLIRTSGEKRVSDFLLWEISYAEIYFSKKYWPDFKSKDFLRAIKWFEKRERRFGMTSEQIQKN